MSTTITRRRFLQNTAAAGLMTGAPAILSAKSPNETVRIAAIGVGGKGWVDVNGAAKHGKIVAFCDVDTGKNRKGGFGAAAEAWPDAKPFVDFRKMIEREYKNIDGVTVSTPDHMHAPATILAIQHGLGVYTQKPLTRTVFEARAITHAAKEAGVSTQMGNQHHSGSGYRSLVKIIQNGLIGKIKAAHTWSNRPVWPQGIQRPTGSDPIPQTLNWDLWLGVAPKRPFKQEAYHPFHWRGWFDFGAGALGDMGCHIIDPVVWSLELGAPTAITYDGPQPMQETFPKSEHLIFEFPGTKWTATDSITMHWYDGGRLPGIEGSHVPQAEELPSQGVMFIGEVGTLVCKHGGQPKLYFNSGDTVEGIPKESGLDHYEQWTNGIRTGVSPNSNFTYAGPLTETVLLGVIASRVGNGRLLWDSENLRFKNSETANQFIQR